MNVLYLERKRNMLRAGTWGVGKHRHTSQYHDVLGHFLGKAVRCVCVNFVPTWPHS
jgi:hypothetical protein